MRNRFGVRGIRCRIRREHGGFRPLAALHGVSGGNRGEGKRVRTTGIGGSGRRRGLLGHHSRVLQNALGLRVHSHLQVRVRHVVACVQAFAKPGAGFIGFARRADVGGDRFLPLTHAREGVRRHVERVRHRRGNVGIGARGGQRLGGQRRHVVGVNDVMRETGMIRVALVERFENLRRLQVLREGLVGGQRRLRDRQRPEDARFHVGLVLAGHQFRGAFVGHHARALGRHIGAGEQPGDGVDEAHLPGCRRAGGPRLVNRRLAVGNGLRRALTGKWVAPIGQGHAPVRHRARGIGLGDALEQRPGFGEPE